MAITKLKSPGVAYPLTTFSSTGIDDNASSTAITIASGGDVTIDGTDASASISSPAILNLKAGDANNEYSTLRFATSADGSIGYVGAKATTTGAYPNSVGNLEFGVQNGASTVTAMTIKSSGNVGIGETNPTSKLHVYGSSGAGSRIHVESGGAGLSAFDGSGSGLLMTANGMNTTSKFTPAIQFGSTDPQLTTTNPKVGAAINGISTEAYGSDTDGGMALALYTRPNNDGTDQDVTERMRIDQDGNVGIGTAAQANSLEVAGGIVATGAVSAYTNTGLYLSSEGSSVMEIGAWRSGSSVAVLTFATDSGSDAAPVERMRIDGSGNLFVGCTTTPSASVHGFGVNPAGVVRTSRNGTSASSHYIFHNDNGDVGSIDTSGTATSYTTSSDFRLKENIVDASSASDDIDDIQVRSFNWKADGSHQKYGMIAQELSTVAPEAVSKGQIEEDMWSVDYSKLVPMMIKEIQDLRARVAELEGA